MEHGKSMTDEDIDFVIEDWIPNTLSVGDIFGEPVK